MIANDAVVLGLLALTLGVIFRSTQSVHPVPRWFYRYVPPLLLCYFVPAVYNTVGLIDARQSALYTVASRYLLPTTLVLLTLAVDVRTLARLGPKALALFFAGTAGVVLGGPAAILLWRAISPETVDGEVWRGMTAIAGSWIGGIANQAAMKEVFQIDSNLFGVMIAVDAAVGYSWMAVLLWMAANHQRLDARSKADASALAGLSERMGRLEAENARIPELPDLMVILAVGFGASGLSHALASPLAAAFERAPWMEQLSLASEFLWIVVLATTFGVLLSFTRARRLEGAGASKVGSAMIYMLVATLGMQMDVRAIFANPGLFGVGLTWIAVHATLLLVAGRLLRAPIFFVAVGSQANIGGAVSAPMVAAAFHPALAPVGVLLAVLGYVVGTYGGWLTAQLMRLAAAP